MNYLPFALWMILDPLVTAIAQYVYWVTHNNTNPSDGAQSLAALINLFLYFFIGHLLWVAASSV